MALGGNRGGKIEDKKGLRLNEGDGRGLVLWMGFNGI